MEKHLLYKFHIWKNAYHKVLIQFSVRMELYEIVWQEVSHIWKLYGTKFCSTRVITTKFYWEKCSTKFDEKVFSYSKSFRRSNSTDKTHK